MAVKFEKILIDRGAFEAASAFDVNGDGILDIVCGGYWYPGPDYKRKVKICDVKQEGEYFDDFSDFPMDVNGDGKVDIVTGAWWGGTLRWRENPGYPGSMDNPAEQTEWTVHDVDSCGPIETIRYFDIDGCGIPEVFPNTPFGPQVFYKLVVDGNGRGCGRFTKHVISEGGSGHGMGFGDVNGDGKIDIILAKGWLEQPDDIFSGPWKFHEEYDFGSASVPILAYDVNGDGLTDLIVGQAHNYGLAWYEQKVDAAGNRSWVKHDIDTTAAQYHDMLLADIDGDGEVELVTGKRYRAHCGNDPGDNDPVGIYYFKIDGGRFEKHVIDYGPAGEHSGVGIYFWVEDIDGDGRLDIVAPGKEGLFLFKNLGEE